MRTRSKLLLASLGAALVLSMALSSASARNFSISNRAFRATWSSLELNSSAGTVRCPITMEGSFHSNTIAKVVNALIGFVTKATARSQSCTGGTASVSPESLPWHIRYRGFSGILPRITLIIISLIGAKFRANVGGFECTAQTSAANPGIGAIKVETGTAGQVGPIIADVNAQIPLRGSFFCEIGGNGTFAGQGAVRLLGNNNLIFIKLI